MQYFDVNSDVSELDLAIRNSWKWEWFKRTDNNNDSIGSWCKKVDVAGEAFCTWCSPKLKYGSEGSKALIIHSKLSTRV